MSAFYKTTFHSDLSHGWLRVYAADLVELGIAGRVSPYSYVSDMGYHAYLERDCDYGLFVQALKARGIRLVVRESFRVEGSPIRQLRPYFFSLLRPEEAAGQIRSAPAAPQSSDTEEEFAARLERSEMIRTHQI